VAQKHKKLFTVLKVLFSAVLLYFIFTKLNLKDLGEVIVRINPLFLVVALLFFTLSKFIAAYRLNLYFHLLSVRLTYKSNLQLYLLGMFYNLFLPGGIGGDAYKGYLIQNKFAIGTKKVVSILVLDRLSGLLLLFIYACGIALWLPQEGFETYRFIFALAIPLSIVVFWLLQKRFFGFVLPIFFKSMAYSAFVQLAQLICIYFLLAGFGVAENISGYLFIFLLSSIVAVLPLTLGGIGSREVTFYYGATWLALNQNTSISVSMLFFLCTAIVSLIGLIYHLKKPVLKTI